METSFVLDDKCLSLEGFESNAFHRNTKSLKEELEESLENISDFDDESEKCLKTPFKDKSLESNGFSKKIYILIMFFIFLSSIIIFQIIKFNYLNIE